MFKFGNILKGIGKSLKGLFGGNIKQERIRQEQEQERIRQEQERIRQEQERIRQEQERIRQEQEQEQERIRQELEQIRQERERIRQELEQIRQEKERQEQEQKEQERKEQEHKKRSEEYWKKLEERRKKKEEEEERRKQKNLQRFLDAQKEEGEEYENIKNLLGVQKQRLLKNFEGLTDSEIIDAFKAKLNNIIINYAGIGSNLQASLLAVKQRVGELEIEAGIDKFKIEQLIKLLKDNWQYLDIEQVDSEQLAKLISNISLFKFQELTIDLEDLTVEERNLIYDGFTIEDYDIYNDLDNDYF